MNNDMYLFNQELLNLAKKPLIDSGNIGEALKLITEVTAHTLKVQRCSIWFYNESHTAIICRDLFETNSQTHSSDMKLEAKDFPSYFAYLLEERTLPAHDAMSDPATCEFSEVYLKPLNILSMLDAPIRVDGKMIGVICCESVGGRRDWNISEQIFIGNITDIISRAIQAKERADAILQLERMNLNLERLVQERTAELEEQKARTANASKMAILGEMASSIAHEINNPLAIILGLTKMFKCFEEDKVSSEEKLKLIANINTMAQRIEKIVRGLRFFARDGVKDEFSIVSVKQILEDTLSLCHQRFKLSGVDLNLDISEDDVYMKCQPVSISQVILNLLTNSYDAIESNDQKWIRIQCEEKENEIQLSVTDSGPGIPAELQDKIMVPFFTTKEVGKGTGLGLSIVKGIVEQHGGSFLIDNRCANTRFVLSFPKAS